MQGTQTRAIHLPKGGRMRAVRRLGGSSGGEARGAGNGRLPPRTADQVFGRSSRRRILPTLVFGKASLNSMYLGRL